MLKLHLGCGPNIKEGYENIDAYVKNQNTKQYDILNMPYKDNEADEVLAEHLAEHIPFKDEEQFWKEIFRVLKKGGIAVIETPDMEWLCVQFVAAQDDFKSFYKVGTVDHYFGNGKSVEHRWGMITTHFFGNQNGGGQFHYNAYTKGKFEAIGRLLGFSNVEVQKIFNKGAQCLRATLTK
jgi:SAM-dependent methyltransferase